jgi:uncharacterized repeat protein (TIGR04052 family)
VSLCPRRAMTRRIVFSVFLLTLSSLAACQSPGVTPAQTVTGGAPAVLQGGSEVTIPVSVVVGDLPLNCTDSYATADGTPWTLADMRMFVSDVRVVDAAGTEVPAAIVPDQVWQNEFVALLDFAGNSGNCSAASAPQNNTLRIRIPDGEFTGLRFRVGVPFAQNHADPTTLTAPLQEMAMHWGWRGGYKFLSFDVKSGEAHAEIHYGSTQCQGEMTAITHCNRPNIANVELQGDPRTGTIVIDAGRFVDSASIADGNCMGPNDPGCVASHHGLGLDPETGLPVGPAPAFSLRAAP